ncbi:MAG: protein kinase, partial [Planctomycetota bacterium]
MQSDDQTNRPSDPLSESTIETNERTSSLDELLSHSFQSSSAKSSNKDSQSSSHQPHSLNDEEDFLLLPPRYRYRGEIGRGGMGVVYLVSDLLLSRDVAMKVLHDTTHPVAAWRFVEESQIASQLQHPGVVPIYDFGKLPEGQPFLTMKLVRGKTLSTLNKERPFAERKEAAVEIFFKICQTMAFAHARMVIHRDLKPSNIMMGSFGEVQVVDWGLSKCLESVDCDVSSESDSKIRSKETPISEDKVEVSDPTEVLTSLASHSVSRPSDSPTTGNSSHSKGSQEVSLDPIPEVRSPRRSSGHSPYRHQGLSSETRSGSVLGTLAYMPPEQARGEVDQLDQTADVFALGGILAYLLTGSASYVAKDSETLRSMAVRGDLTECFERLEQSQCGEELDEIVGKCLALAPKDRYRDAGELAERISNFRNRAAERLKAAELEKAASNARAAEATRAATAEKRRRRSTTLLAIVLGVAAILGSAGGLVFQRKQNALSEAEWNNRKLVREKQFEESIREQSLKGRIENELAIGENELANSDSIEPTPNQIDRAKLSIDRVIDMLGRSKNPKSLEARLQALSARWDNLRKTRTVLREIDSLLIDSTQIQETSDEIAVVDSNSSLPTKATIDVPASLASMHDFGLQLQESTEQEDYSTLRHLPSWARPRIQIFLHQLRNAIAADSFYVDVDEDQWKILDRGLIQSVKGAELEQWEDGSIESFGKNPLCDVYEFEFDISTSDFDRLRIEAMPGTDGMGPESGKLTSLGRAEDGSAAMTDLRLSWIDATGTEVDLPILASAATYCFEGEPLGLRNWNLTFSPQQTQHAYFRIDNSGVRSEDEVSGKLRILFKNHSEAEWGDQNFARVRLSIGKSLQSKFVKTPLEVLLNRLSEDESDDWRKRFWNLLTTSNSAEMLELASDPSIHEQPIDLVIELAEQLTKAGTTDAVRTAVSDSNWIIKEPKISSVVEASVDDQGWINLLSSGPYYTTLDFLHELPKGAIPTAIRIETTAPRDDESAIREWDEIVISGREKLTRGLRSLEASQVLYDHRRIAGSTLDAAFDRNSRTSWKVAHPSGQEVCTLLINLKSNTMVEYEDSLRIKLDSNAGVS